MQIPCDEFQYTKATEAFKLSKMACKKKYILAADADEPNGNDIDLAHFVEVRSDETGSETHPEEREPVEGDDSESSSDSSSGDSKENSDEDEDSCDDGSMSGSASNAPAPERKQKADSAASEKPRGETSNDRMERIERVLADMSTVITRLQAYDRPSSSRVQTDTSWTVPCTTINMEGTSSTSRWDNPTPFPSGVSANRMWEEWNRYIQNFEIKASLNNVNDPVKRCQRLFLDMGPEQQEIILAAKLRPSLEDGNCYRVFVKNITDYFRSMTDTAAEHEAFSCMKQERVESAVAFHARLMCKVRLCNYSAEDQDRFVRAQLLKGLKNKDIVKAARTYGHEVNYIVQAATRDEAYEAETAQPEDVNVFQVHNRYPPKRQPNWKQKSSNERIERDNGPPEKRRKSGYGDGRRSKCPNCNFKNHRYGVCPAINKNCANCGTRGHFAAACRTKRVNAVHHKREDLGSDMSEDDTPRDTLNETKQVLKC